MNDSSTRATLLYEVFNVETTKKTVAIRPLLLHYNYVKN